MSELRRSLFINASMQPLSPVTFHDLAPVVARYAWGGSLLHHYKSGMQPNFRGNHQVQERD